MLKMPIHGEGAMIEVREERQKGKGKKGKPKIDRNLGIQNSRCKTEKKTSSQRRP